ncbi:MAG: transcriptional repressor [Herpetosiphonaceae bacterium]|nr:transcriptional repressor [Herpetosiphonaceae bacterium]
MKKHYHHHGELSVQTMLETNAWCDGAEQALLVAGHRSTLPRRAVLSWIAQQHGPFTAEVLVRQLESERGESSRATIYRTLDWLRSAGWIARVHSEGAEHAYARVLPGHHHHAVCTRCGVILVVGGCLLEALVGPTLAAIDFEIHSHLLELYGVCSPCRGKKEPSYGQRSYLI